MAGFTSAQVGNLTVNVQRGGSNVKHAHVKIVGGPADVAFMFLTDNAGRVRVSLPIGTYTVSVSDPEGGTPSATTVTTSAPNSGGFTVNIP